MNWRKYLDWLTITLTVIAIPFTLFCIWVVEFQPDNPAYYNFARVCARMLLCELLIYVYFFADNYYQNKR